MHGQVSEVMKTNDTRLHLNAIFNDMSKFGQGANILNTDGSCINEAYVILTFSIGILQSGNVHLSPKLLD